MGAAIGHQIGRHVHPAAKPETSPDPAPHTGIDYLALVHDRHTAALRVAPVNYADLTQPIQGSTNTVGDACITGTQDGGGLDAPLEAELALKAERLAADLRLVAELAAFAALRSPSPPISGPEDAIPGQLDLLDPTDDDDNPQEHP
jgi:hypothetical protein